MTPVDTERRLAAILFTDIAGYTSMMQHDEALAMSAVRQHHHVLEQQVPANRGIIQQYYGDGSLSIFNSATDAVRCAHAMQKELLQAPEVPVRMGIHIGEIYSEDNKIFGDGVNLASRIESIGQPGAVLFSRHVFEKVRNHPEFQVKLLGVFAFKNVDDPVEVYALTNEGLRFPDRKHIEGKLKTQSGTSRKSWLYAAGLALVACVVAALYIFPEEANSSPSGYVDSIAVLQFDNRSDDEKENYLSIGIPEDILTELAQIQGLKVISRSSSMRFQDAEADNQSWKSIADELGVENLLTGSVYRHEGSIHVNVKLINAKEERILWAEKYTRDFKDVLSVQQEIAAMVSEKLRIRLTPESRNRLDARSRIVEEAYINYLKGREVLLRSSGSVADLEKAIAFFEAALDADSTFAKAWAGLADAHLEGVFWHRTTDGEGLPKARLAVQKALQYDPELGEAYAASGAVEIFSFNLKAARTDLLHALKLNPSCAFAHERLSWVYLFSGRVAESFEQQLLTMELDPLSTRYKGSYLNTFYIIGEYSAGIAKAEEFLKAHPHDNFLLWSMAYLRAGNGEFQKSIDYLDERTLGKGTNWVYSYCYAQLGNQQGAQEVLDTLLARDQRGFVPDFMISVAYAAVGDKENAIKRLDGAINSGGESFFAWGIDHDPMFRTIRDDPRFKAIVRRIDELYSE